MDREKEAFFWILGRKKEEFLFLSKLLASYLPDTDFKDNSLIECFLWLLLLTIEFMAKFRPTLLLYFSKFAFFFTQKFSKFTMIFDKLSSLDYSEILDLLMLTVERAQVAFSKVVFV